MFFVLSACLVLSASAKPAIEKIKIGSIGFPEAAEIYANKNVTNNRRPVYMPSVCPEGELYYPGDQTDDWICDCRPGYLYDTKTDTCWPAFRRGPCLEGEYLVLPNNNSVFPICKQNTCPDKQVLWNGKCEHLGSTSACLDLYPPAVLAVDSMNRNLTCEQTTIDMRFGEAVVVVPVICPPGCRRSVANQCVKAQS